MKVYLGQLFYDGDRQKKVLCADSRGGYEWASSAYPHRFLTFAECQQAANMTPPLYSGRVEVWSAEYAPPRDGSLIAILRVSK
jgi:hypothetical protein